ncbi:MAG: archease [Nanoarchaeota archaeon]
MTYKFLEHTADIKIGVEGKSLANAFKSSALALREVMFHKEKIKVKSKLKKVLKVTGKDKDALLYNFLEEFLYLLDAENFVFSKILSLKIDAGEGSLVAEVWGDRASNYKFRNEVKAITYNEMFVRESGGKVKLQFVLDV